jgi:tetratricopeptide (TPR) repeat protein
VPRPIDIVPPSKGKPPGGKALPPGDHPEVFQSSTAPRYRKLWICLVLAGLTLAAFWPVFNNEFINFDDQEYVTENPNVLSGLTWPGVKWAFVTGHAANWHPLTWLSHMLDVQLFGLKPGFHHGMSLGLHVTNTLLLFVLLTKLTRTIWPSAFMAAVFGVHPLHVESVAWVSERKDVLSALFFFLTLIFYERYVRKKTLRHGNSQPAEKCFPILDYSLAALFFALGLMSKPMLVTLPFLLLLLDYWPLQRLPAFPSRDGMSGVQKKLAWKQVKQRAWPLLFEKTLFFVMAAASCAATYFAQQRHGAVAPAGLTLDSRIANAFFSYFRYLEKFVCPTNLAIFYPHPATVNPELRNWITWHAGIAIIATVFIFFLTIRYLRSKPYFLVGFWWYFGMLVPVIGFLQVGSQAMADRYMYLPMIGILLALTPWAMSFAGKFPGSRATIIGVSAASICACFLLCHRQVTFWRSSLSVFRHNLAVTPNNATAHFNYGAALEAEGNLDEAMGHYQLALASDPFRPDAYYNLGHALAAKGKLKEAEKSYRSAIELKPDYEEAHQNLATTLYTLGQWKEAEAEFAESIRLKPEHGLAHSNLGKLYCDEGRYADSAEQYQIALRLEPASATAESGLGLALVFQGKFPEALEHLRQALALKPNNPEALVNLANALSDSGNTSEAKNYYARALELNPRLVSENIDAGDSLAKQGQAVASLARYMMAVRLGPEDPAAREKLGLALAGQGNLPEAITNFVEVVRLRPDAQAHYNLALAFVASHRHREAVAEYEKAISLKPDWLDALNDLAWLLATHPEATLRNGTKAVELARKTCEAAKPAQARYYGTLDAALAESGRFDEARQACRKAIELANHAEQKDIAAAAEARLRLYESNQPYHQAN